MTDDRGVLIADQSTQRIELKEFLNIRGISARLTADDGYDVYKRLQSGSYDIVVINAVMPDMTALRLITLTNAEKERPPFFYIVISGCSEAEERELLLCGNTFILKPNYDPAKLAERISLMGGNKGKSTPFNRQLELVVTNLIRKLGISPHLKGYIYLRTALMLTVTNKEMRDGITKNLYPEIARLHDTTPQRVERAIRHSVTTVYARGQEQYMSEVFSRFLPAGRSYPTNHELVSVLTDYVLMQMKSYR